MTDPMTLSEVLAKRATFKWEPLIDWTTRHGGEVVKQTIECAGCHKATPVTEAHAIVIFGVHGDELPVPGAVHCGQCVLRMEAREAWVIANAEQQGRIKPYPKPDRE